jgi:uncharacterized membrane protein YidH (DUF202 family)
MQHTSLDGDEALQAERTSLSWFRTALGFAAVVALAVRQAPSGSGRLAAAVVGLVTVIAAIGASTIRSRRLRTAAIPPTASPQLLATLSIGLVAINALAIALFH